MDVTGLGRKRTITVGLVKTRENDAKQKRRDFCQKPYIFAGIIFYRKMADFSSSFLRLLTKEKPGR